MYKYVRRIFLYVELVSNFCAVIILDIILYLFLKYINFLF